MVEDWASDFVTVEGSGEKGEKEEEGFVLILLVLLLLLLLLLLVVLLLVVGGVFYRLVGSLSSANRLIMHKGISKGESD